MSGVTLTPPENKMTKMYLLVIVFAVLYLLTGCNRPSENTTLSGNAIIGGKSYDLTKYIATPELMKEWKIKYTDEADGIQDLKKRGIWKQNPKLTQEEQFALFIYWTAEGFEMNKSLRNGDVASAGTKEYILMAASALNKLPKFACTVYRGLHQYGNGGGKSIDEIIRDAEKAGRLVETGFLSTSPSLATAKRFAPVRGDYIFHIKSDSCRDISFIIDMGRKLKPSYPAMKEYLFPPGEEFLFKESPTNNQNSFHMEYYLTDVKATTKPKIKWPTDLYYKPISTLMSLPSLFKITSGQTALLGLISTIDEYGDSQEPENERVRLDSNANQSLFPIE